MLQRVHEQVEGELADLSGTKRENLTRSLLDAASEEFDEGATVQVYGRADDKALLTKILTDYDGYTFAGEYDCLGGVVVESATSRVRVNNTFDSVLEAVWEDNLKELSNRLFDQ